MSRVPPSRLQIGPFWFVTFDAPGRLYEVSLLRTGAVMRIIADCHEPAEILKLLRTADGVDGSAVEIETGSLDVGDYLIGPGAAVERKADGDFAASLLDGRMAEQAAKLRATYDKVVWIIEGNPYDGHIALEPKVIIGAISHLALVERAALLPGRGSPAGNGRPPAVHGQAATGRSSRSGTAPQQAR